MFILLCLRDNYLSERQIYFSIFIEPYSHVILKVIT
jgi:hypothetical protein